MAAGVDWLERLEATLRDPAILQQTEEAVEGQPAVAEVRPRAAEHIGEVLAFAQAEGLAVLPVGGGTAIHLGNPPRRVDLLLHTTSMEEGLEHSPEDMVATVPAGLALAKANAALAPEGQGLPLDAPRPDRATVGGLLATACLGPRAERFGHPRDAVLGMRVALPNGDLVRMGGRVVKNVTGYDLAKLHIGALGTLGVILEVTFKLAPLPEATATAAYAFLTMDEALRAAEDIRGMNLEPLAFAVVNGTAASDLDMAWHPAHLLVEFGDVEAVVQRQLRQAEEAARLRGAVEDQVWRGQVAHRHWEALKPLPSGWGVTFRGIVPSAAVDPFLHAAEEAAQAHGQGTRALVYPGRGVVYLGLPRALAPAAVAALLQELGALARSLGGHVTLERAPPEAKRGLDVWGLAPSGLSLMDRVRRKFDPMGVLNPGRYHGGL